MTRIIPNTKPGNYLVKTAHRTHRLEEKLRKRSVPALGALALAIFAGCFRGDDTGEDDVVRLAPLRTLAFSYMEATIDVNPAGSSVTLAPSSDWAFKAELLPITKRMSSGNPPPRWLVQAMGMRIPLSLDTMIVGDSLYPGPIAPGISLQPATTRLFRIGTFGGSPKVDSMDWVVFGLFDRKAGTPFALVYVDRAATMIFDTMACGNSIHDIVHFPAPGYYALASGSDPHKPSLRALEPSDDLAYYSAAMDFIRNRRMSALSGCRDYQAQKEAVLGRWKRMTPAGSGSAIQYLDFRTDDSLIQLDEEAGGMRSVRRLQFFADTARLYYDDAGNGYDYALSDKGDTLYLGSPGIALVRDDGPDPSPTWLGQLKMAVKVPLGFHYQLGGIYADGIAGGAGSAWVKTRQGSNAVITRYDSSGTVLDTLVRMVAPGFSEAGYGLAMEGDSILWIPAYVGAMRVRMPGEEDLPAFNPGPPPFGGLLSGKSVVGFDRGRVWTVDASSNLLGWSIDSTDVDTLPKPPTNFGRRTTVAGGHLLRAEGNRVFIRKLDGSAYISTLQTDEWGEFTDIAVTGNDLWVVWRDYRDDQTYYLARFIVPGKEPGTKQSLLPP